MVLISTLLSSIQEYGNGVLSYPNKESISCHKTSLVPIYNPHPLPLEYFGNKGVGRKALERST